MKCISQDVKQVYQTVVATVSRERQRGKGINTWYSNIVRWQKSSDIAGCIFEKKMSWEGSIATAKYDRVPATVRTLVRAVL